MGPSRNKNKILSQSEQFILLGHLELGRIFLELILQKKNKQTGQFSIRKHFCKNVLLGLNQELRQNFSDLRDIIKHLTNPENFDIDEENGHLLVKKIIEKEGMAPQSKIVARIKLDQKQLIYQQKKQGGEKLTQKYKRYDEEEQYDDGNIELNENVQTESLWKKSNEGLNFTCDKNIPIQIQNVFTELSNTYSQKMNQLWEQIDVIKNENETTKRELKVIKKKLKEMEQNRKQPSDTPNKLTSEILQKIQSNFQTLFSSIQKISAKPILNQIEIHQIAEKKQLRPSKRSKGKFTFFQSIVTSTDDGPVSIILNQIIQQKKTVKIRILQTTSLLGIGIADSRFEKIEKPLNHPSVIVLQSNGILKYFNKTQKSSDGLDLRKGVVLGVTIDLDRCMLCWQKNGEALVQINQCDQIRSSGIEWVPLIILNGKNDSFQILD